EDLEFFAAINSPISSGRQTIDHSASKLYNLIRIFAPVHYRRFSQDT
ncbi:hypothetical protein E2320_015169, partial [Naja naja]